MITNYIDFTRNTKKEGRYKLRSKRTNINSSRYNYRYDLVKSGILSSELKKISKVLIPIEDNYLFSIPVFILTIPELNFSIHMQQVVII